MRIFPSLLLAAAFSFSLLHGESIGLNFSLEGDADTELEMKDNAGVPDVSQDSWNNLPGAIGERSGLVDSAGREISAFSVKWTVPPDASWRAKAGSDWGFKGPDLKLQRGYIQYGGVLMISGIPYKKYDVYVYLNAGENGGVGSVDLSGDKTLFYNVGWLGGKFQVSESPGSLEAAPSANVVVFRELSAKELDLNWKGSLSGGWTGVSGVQIVKVP